MASRFVRPETTVLPLSRGDTVIVKTRLSAGEQREIYARLYVVDDDGRLRVNPLQSGLAMIVAYLVDWTIVDDDGAVVPIRGLSVADLERVVLSLDHTSFVEIKKAVEAHEAAQDATRDAQKKTPDGSPLGEATSPSPSVSAGALVGSVN